MDDENDDAEYYRPDTWGGDPWWGVKYTASKVSNFVFLVLIGGAIFGAIGGTAVGMLPFMFMKGLDYPQAETVMGCFQLAGMPFGIILSYLNDSYWRPEYSRYR